MVTFGSSKLINRNLHVTNSYEYYYTMKYYIFLFFCLFLVYFSFLKVYWYLIKIVMAPVYQIFIILFL